MCLGIPGLVVEIVPGYADQLALVDVMGAQRRINVGMLEAPPSSGDWLLIHMGFAMEIIDADKAEQAMSGLELMGQARPAVEEIPVEEIPVQRVAMEGVAGSRIRRRFEVSGLVQGVGFRPFVYVTAAGLGLTGSVANTADGVLVEAEGDAEAVRALGRRLRTDAPPLAVVTDVSESELPTRGGTDFTIGASFPDYRARTLASPDVATCDDCLRELRDPADRRYRHPFITCTNCGPRFTIITGLPYDRAATTMSGFTMCAACRAEYDDPADRRFHAQPIACPDCGPTLSLLVTDRDNDPNRLVAGGANALREAREMLAAGRIVAVKGLGGYHLACDARNEAAVAELRRRKRRGDKPFAVMVADIDVARRLVVLNDDEERLLTGVRRPIVLLARVAETPAGPHANAGTAGVAAAVAPGNPDLGLMLAYTPLHALLFGLDGDPAGPDALVMTSGNLAGEPIVTDDEEALRRLARLADAFLRHDRGIRVPCDDSVSRHVGGAELPIRRSRGYAPMPVALPFEIAPTLAVGADLKNTCALGAGRYAWLSQHIGDMDDLSTVEALRSTEGHLELLTGVRPEALVADLHPGYRSTGWAREHAAGRPVRLVQHHHAHIVAVMAEHGLGSGEQVIGVAFDGTGFGPDGAVWGGEVLIADYKSYRRAAHLGYVPLAGGDASVLRPYRMALAQLRAAGVAWRDDLPPVGACPPTEREVLARQLETGFGCVPTSSMGRLFDAVASLVGVRHLVDYEAEAAIGLEGLARSAPRRFGSPYLFALRTPATGPIAADPAPMIRAVVADVRAGVRAEVVAAKFHAGVAALIVDLAERCREHTGLGVVALGGGVFGNTVLLSSAERALTDRGFSVLRPHLLPPNDGGIALGQLLIGAAG
jgi:hydrogenase maturation protein HypF